MGDGRNQWEVRSRNEGGVRAKAWRLHGSRWLYARCWLKKENEITGSSHTSGSSQGLGRRSCLPFSGCHWVLPREGSNLGAASPSSASLFQPLSSRSSRAAGEEEKCSKEGGSRWGLFSGIQESKECWERKWEKEAQTTRMESVNWPSLVNIHQFFCVVAMSPRWHASGIRQHNVGRTTAELIYETFFMHVEWRFKRFLRQTKSLRN